jgi:hypothetical protein
MRLSKGRKRWLFCCGIVAVAIVIYQAKTARYHATPNQIFHRFVLDPIPTSVTNIQADCPRDDGVGGYVYVLRFGIGRDDLDRIVESRSFKQVHLEDYDDIRSGGISYGWGEEILAGHPSLGYDHKAGVTVYQPKDQEPTWFDLGEWQGPEMYLYEEANGVDPNHGQYLIYNDDLKHAYLIAKHWSTSSIVNWSGVKDTYKWK